VRICPGMRFCMVLAAAGVLFAGLSGAQPYPGDILSLTSTGYLVKTSQVGGPALSIADLNGTTCHGLALDHDNARVILTMGSPSAGGIFSYDPQAMAVTTVYPSTLFSYRDVVVNQDGDIVFTGFDQSGSPAVYGLFKLSHGIISTIATSAQIGPNVYLDAGLEININTGNYLAGAGSFNYGLYDIASDGTTQVLSRAAGNRYSIAQDLATGDVYTTAFQKLCVLKGGTPGGTLSTITPGGTGIYWYAIETGRASEAGTRVWGRYGTRVFHYEPGSQTLTTMTTTSPPGTHYEMVFEGQRTLATVKMGPRKWVVNIHFPGEAGARYVIGLSATGCRPVTVLPGGRRICLAIDDLTLLSMRGLLHPFFNCGTGILDAGHRATATLDVTGLPAFGGLPVWACALTLTETGIGTISDPIVIKLP